MKYFLHDTNAFQDEKITELFIGFGYEGVGLFYTILEKLAMQEKPIKTEVLKKQLFVGKKLEKCWKFLESSALISSNNGETFNENLLKFSEKFQIKKEKNRERISKWRENQSLTENVTRNESVCNTPKDNISKDNISKEDKSSSEAIASGGIEILSETIQEPPITPSTVRPKKPKPEPTTLHHLGIKLFCELYESKFNTKFEFSGGRDGKAIKELLAKVGNKTKEGMIEPTDQNILDGFEFFLKSIKDEWVIKNYSPAVINSKFNELFKNAKNGTTSNNSRDSATDYAGFLKRNLQREAA